MKLRGCVRNVHVKSCFVKTVSLPCNVLIYIHTSYFSFCSLCCPLTLSPLPNQPSRTALAASSVSNLDPLSEDGMGPPVGAGDPLRAGGPERVRARKGSSFCCLEIWPFPTSSMFWNWDGARNNTHNSYITSTA